MSIQCSACIAYCRNNDRLDLLSLIHEKEKDLGCELRREPEGTLLFAPAGNYPADPAVTVCGLATSFQALAEMRKEATGNETLEQTCLEAVYKGSMAVNLCILLKALNIDRLIADDVRLKIDGKEKNLCELDVNDFGKSGYFVRAPESLQLTQMMCCWHKDEKSAFNAQWLEYGKQCREEGYFSNLLDRFLKSDKAKIFILLGCKGENQALVSSIISNKKNVLLMAFDKKSVMRQGDPDNFTKLIFSVHHPANTGFIYNNYKTVKSVLYSYYENGRTFDFITKDYGKNRNAGAMDGYRKYYKELNEKVERLFP